MKGTSLEDFDFYTREEACTPPRQGLFLAVSDSWWPVDKDGRIAFYNPRDGNGRRRFAGQGSPQCNANKMIADRRATEEDWAVGVIFLDVVYYREDVSDYYE